MAFLKRAVVVMTSFLTFCCHVLCVRSCVCEDGRKGREGRYVCMYAWLIAKLSWHRDRMQRSTFRNGPCIRIKVVSE